MGMHASNFSSHRSSRAPDSNHAADPYIPSYIRSLFEPPLSTSAAPQTFHPPTDLSQPADLLSACRPRVVLT